MVLPSIICDSSLPSTPARGQCTPMTPPFSSQDLGRIFNARTITRGRSLGLAGQVEVQLEGDTITAVVQDSGVEQNIRITPSLLGRRVVFDRRCSCSMPGCAHLAAGALAALDRFPSLRKPEQQTFLDLLAAKPRRSGSGSYSNSRPAWRRTLALFPRCSSASVAVATARPRHAG